MCTVHSIDKRRSVLHKKQKIKRTKANEMKKESEKRMISMRLVCIILLLSPWNTCEGFPRIKYACAVENRTLGAPKIERHHRWHDEINTDLQDHLRRSKILLSSIQKSTREIWKSVTAFHSAICLCLTSRHWSNVMIPSSMGKFHSTLRVKQHQEP